MKNLLRKSVNRHKIGSEVTASQIVLCANEFLTDVMKPQQRRDAHAVSYHDGILKIVTRSSSASHHLQEYDQELKNRMMEKFHDLKLTRILFQINKSVLDESL